MNYTQEDIDEWMERLAIRNEECEQLERERDEAITTIEDAKRALKATDYEGILLAAMRVKEERDEAMNAIVGWENKWKYAVDMAARAEIERDDALAELDNMQNQRDFAMKVIHRLEKERDEARDVVKILCDQNE